MRAKVSFRKRRKIGFSCGRTKVIGINVFPKLRRSQTVFCFIWESIVSSQEKSTLEQSQDENVEKKTYEAPTLIRIGKLTEMTGSGS